jgi:hypothetical protein
MNTESMQRLSNHYHIPATIVEHLQGIPFVPIPIGATNIFHLFLYFGRLQTASGISIKDGTIPALTAQLSF